MRRQLSVLFPILLGFVLAAGCSSDPDSAATSAQPSSNVDGQSSGSAPSAKWSCDGSAELPNGSNVVALTMTTTGDATTVSLEFDGPVAARASDDPGAGDVRASVQVYFYADEFEDPHPYVMSLGSFSGPWFVRLNRMGNPGSLDLTDSGTELRIDGSTATLTTDFSLAMPALTKASEVLVGTRSLVERFEDSSTTLGYQYLGGVDCPSGEPAPAP